MITSHNRGHEIKYINNVWVYADSGESVAKNLDRACRKCGRSPINGRDACLGDIPNVKSACCGHGVTKKILIYE